MGITNRVRVRAVLTLLWCDGWLMMADLSLDVQFNYIVHVGILGVASDLLWTWIWRESSRETSY